MERIEAAVGYDVLQARVAQRRDGARVAHGGSSKRVGNGRRGGSGAVASRSLASQSLAGQERLCVVAGVALDGQTRTDKRKHRAPCRSCPPSAEHQRVPSSIVPRPSLPCRSVPPIYRRDGGKSPNRVLLHSNCLSRNLPASTATSSLKRAAYSRTLRHRSANLVYANATPLSLIVFCRGRPSP